MEESYPTQPVDVVFEVLSEGEDDIEKKCREYSRIGIPQVFVFDPVQRKIAEWKGTTLLDVTDVLLRNGVTITGKTIWSELDRRLKERRPIGPVI
jgi:Uma2 family endonuclease